MRFRSASVVKLLIALDVLGERGTGSDLPDADRVRLDSMLRSSDDDAASHYWERDGGSAIVTRMIRRLGLRDTSGPPADHPGHWGYSALTAADTVRVYRYLLDSAPGPVRDFVMGNLRECTRLGSDGFDQHFGIPGAFGRPWAAKQGWSGFGAGGGPAPAGGVDLARPALHTTGTVGAGDRSIVAVFTLHPVGTPQGTAYTRITELTRSLDVPGANRPAHG